jgi:hypothetical protein
MSDHNRFRFRSPERDRETDERRFGHIRMVTRSAIADAEAEASGLRARLAEARRAAISLVPQVDAEFAATRRAALTNRDRHLLTIEQRLVQLEDHLTHLRTFARRFDRLIDRLTGEATS